MRARQLEVFIAVMRAGTVTAAARMLNISQPALSQTLLHTEDELGFTLFERVKGRLRPTPEALEIFADAERLSAGLEGLRRKTTDLRLGRTGLVRVAASPPPAMAILPRAFTGFRAQHPNILLRSHMAPIAAIIDMLRAGDASLGVAMDDRLPPDIEAEVIGSVGFSCLLPAGHVLAGKTELTLADLAGEELISYRGNTRPADELAHAARAHGSRFRRRSRSTCPFRGRLRPGRPGYRARRRAAAVAPVCRACRQAACGGAGISYRAADLAHTGSFAGR
ncbi:transcriptional regulator [Mesorhizobium amorphae CCBAU 01583]|nr:transcriptional regulator [Mesorhizobium amorphae CCBAU 01583]